MDKLYGSLSSAALNVNILLNEPINRLTDCFNQSKLPFQSIDGIMEATVFGDDAGVIVDGCCCIAGADVGAGADIVDVGDASTGVGAAADIVDVGDASTGVGVDGLLLFNSLLYSLSNWSSFNCDTGSGAEPTFTARIFSEGCDVNGSTDVDNDSFNNCINGSALKLVTADDDDDNDDGTGTTCDAAGGDTGVAGTGIAND